MIQEIDKRFRRASELAAIWSRYFPGITVGADYFMVALDEFPFNALAPAIKAVAKKRVQLHGNMTLQQMLACLQGSAANVLKEKIASGLYQERRNGGLCM